MRGRGHQFIGRIVCKYGKNLGFKCAKIVGRTCKIQTFGTSMNSTFMRARERGPHRRRQGADSQVKPRGDNPAGRWAAARLATALALAAVSVAAACGEGAGAPAHGPTESSAPGSSGSAASAPPQVSGVFFAERRPGGEDMMAEIRGQLVLDHAGCLRVRYGGGSSVIVWPTGFEPEKVDGEVRVLDGKGKVVARVGERAYMAGGGTPIRGNRAVDERTRQELLERCPGSYWIAAEPVRIPRQQ